MQLARELGTVVSSVKYPTLEGLSLLIIQPVDEHLEARGDFYVAIDAVGAGTGDLVFWEGSREAPAAVPSEPPVTAAIVGLVDKVTITVPEAQL